MIRIPILMYHSIDNSISAACVRPKQFEEQMAYLKRVGFEAVDLDTVFSARTQMKLEMVHVD